MTVFLRNGAKALLSSHQLALPPPNPHSPVASHGAPSFLRSLRHRRPPQGDCGGGGGARIRRRRQVRNPGGGCLPVSRMLHPPPHSRLLRSDFQVSSLLPHPSPCSSLQETLLASISFAGHEFNFTFPKLPRSQICGFPHFGGGFRGFCTGKLEFEDGDVDCEKGDEAVELIHQCSANPAEVDRICKVIEELFALDRNMEAVLDECGIQLTCDLVVDVLQRFKHARKPAFRFFCWADRMPGFAHDSRSFNAMMSILGKSRQFETMVSMLGDMGERGLLTMETFTIAIRAFASAKERKKSVAVFELMNKYSFKAGVETFNCLLDSLGREKLAKEAELLFEKLKGRFTPNLQTYTVLLNAWCKSKNLLEAARVWNEMVDRGFKPDVVAHNIMLDALLKVKKKADAIKLFEVMRGKGPAPNVRSYTVLIRDFCKQGKLTEAAAYLDEMASSGLDPDAAVYTCLITGFGNLRKMGEVYGLLREMEEKGCAPDGRTYNALIKLLTSRRMADEAVGVYNKMVASGIQPSIHTYNMIMKACFVTGKDEAGQAFWDEMGRSGCCPDENSYTVLIRGLVREGRSELACRYVEEMIDKGMRIPEIDYCKFVADFARCGHPNVLEELAEKMRDSGKAEVSEVFARWAQIAKRGAKRRDPLRVLW